MSGRHIRWFDDVDVIAAADISLIMNLSPNKRRRRSDAERVAAFFHGLPQVPISTEHEKCSICLEQYPHPKACSIAVKAMNLERPVKLPCGHVFGDKCLKRWLGGGHDDCPLCRRKWDIEKADK